DCLAKFRGAEPGLLVFGKRRGENLVEPYEFGIEHQTGIMSSRWRFLLQAVEVFSVQSVDQMNFTATKAQQFNVAIALNVEANGIQIGQRISILVFFPIIRVASQKDGGAGRVVGDIKGTENGHLLLGRMGGENRDLIEEAFETSHRSREGDNDCVGGRHLHNNLALAGAE